MATAETDDLIGAAELGRMKPTAVLVNTSRGEVVDEAALIAALQGGMIAAAGVDVFEQEPPDPANPLLSLPNVVVTPHAAGFARGSVMACGRAAAVNVVEALAGRRPPLLKNPEALERWESRFGGAGE